MHINDGAALAGRVSLWIRNQVDAAKADGLVFGMSGGIDSSVAAALAKMAVGRKALGLILPCHSNPESEQHARLVARKFSIDTVTVDLTTIYDDLVTQLPDGEGMAIVNIRPRLRMTVLYYYGNLYNKLVLGTSNKSEMMVGYFTKWGDGGADLQPMGGLFKAQIRQLAKDLDMPKEILNKPPTADLWAGQTDEQELGLTYEELDVILAGIEAGKIGSFDPDKVKKVKNWISQTDHKRKPVPVFRDE
ncbi:MAG: NAD(+) synthase [Armatimonadota bacterium]|nr:NAD(+) synthase [Armatimonadota bacterium]